MQTCTVDLQSEQGIAHHLCLVALYCTSVALRHQEKWGHTAEQKSFEQRDTVKMIPYIIKILGNPLQNSIFLQKQTMVQYLSKNDPELNSKPSTVCYLQKSFYMTKYCITEVYRNYRSQFFLRFLNQVQYCNAKLLLQNSRGSNVFPFNLSNWKREGYTLAYCLQVHIFYHYFGNELNLYFQTSILKPLRVATYYSTYCYLFS